MRIPPASFWTDGENRMAACFPLGLLACAPLQTTLVLGTFPEKEMPPVVGNTGATSPEGITTPLVGLLLAGVATTSCWL